MKSKKYPREIQFQVHYKSEGETFSGRFVVRRPNIMQQMEIEGEKSRILKGHYFDPSNPGCGIPPHYAIMAEAMAFLKIAIVEAPDWWDEGEVYDPDLITHIYDEAQEVDPFRNKLTPEQKQQGGSSLGIAGSDGDTERNASNADDSLAEMVSTEI